MKKISLLFLSLIMCLFFSIGIVNATTETIDPDNNIEMPTYLYSDKENSFTVSRLTNYTSSYQIKDVSSSSGLVAKIDSLITLQAQYKDLSDSYNAETDATQKSQIQASMNTLATTIDNTKNDIKTLVDNPISSNWVTATNDTIPNTNVTNKLYYVVWVRVTSGENSYYDYGAYKTIITGEEPIISTVSNPATGLETDILYIGVALLIIIGSVLVTNKNKEKYE